MRVLGEDASGGELFAELAPGGEFRVDVNSGPEAAATDLDYSVSDQTVQATVKVSTEFGGPLLVFAGSEQA